MTEPTTPAPELTALSDDDIVDQFESAVVWASFRTPEGDARQNVLRAELKRRLAAERPELLRGSVVIPPETLERIQDWAERVPPDRWTEDDRRALHVLDLAVSVAFDAALAASSAPADAALGQGEGTE